MATEALRLLLAQHNLVQMGTRQQLVSRLETHFNNSPANALMATVTSSSAITLPQEELAQIISSIIDEKVAARQDGSQQHNQSQLVPNPHVGSLALVPSLPTHNPTQNGGQVNNTTSSQAFPAFSPSDGGQQQQQGAATSPKAFLAFNSSSEREHNNHKASPHCRKPSLPSTHLAKANNNNKHHHTTANWYVYDVEFRPRASHNLSLNWEERDVQLYLDTFTGLPNSGCLLEHPCPPLWLGLLWMKWQGLYFFDMVLPFGLRSTPFLFD